MTRTLLVAACVVALAACAHDGIRLTPVPLHAQDISGHWVVDVSRSEDPDAAGASGGGSRGGMGGGHHGGGMGGMGGGGMGGGGMGGGGMGGGHHGGGGGGGQTAGSGNGSGDDTGRDMRRGLLLPDKLDLAMQPDNLMITSDGHAHTVPMITAQDAMTDETRAGWDGDSLAIVIPSGDKKRGDIVQHYTVAPDHSRLVVTTEFKRGSKQVSVVREFTPAPVVAGS